MTVTDNDLRSLILSYEALGEKAIFGVEVVGSLRELQTLRLTVKLQEKEMKQMQREFREELHDAIAQARHEERYGEPYGTY